jgi:hypothetical protein
MLPFKAAHEEKKTTGYGCPRMFVSLSAMLLHLESGSCESRVNDKYIADLAFECYQSGHFTSSNETTIFSGRRARFPSTP